MILNKESWFRSVVNTKSEIRLYIQMFIKEPRNSLDMTSDVLTSSKNTGTPLFQTINCVCWALVEGLSHCSRVNMTSLAYLSSATTTTVIIRPLTLIYPIWVGLSRAHRIKRFYYSTENCYVPYITLAHCKNFIKFSLLLA